jgi:hypothetical protein
MTTQRLFIAGNLPMSRAEAQAHIDDGRKVVLHLWGEGPYAATITATATGLEYQKELLLLGDAPAGERPPVEAYLIES